MRHLQILAGPAALRHIERNGLRAADIRAVAGAAGGPKGLVLQALDRYIFGRWLAGAGEPVHLVGASIGAFRLCCAAQPDPEVALARFARKYIDEEYEPPAGQAQSAANIGRRYADLIAAILGGQAQQALAHPRMRLHVVTDRGRGLLRTARRGSMHVGFAALAAANLVHRRLMGALLERVVFSDPRARLPLPLTDLPTRHVPLSAANLLPAVLASGSIPFWFPAVTGIPDAPPGAYWDGGITDYQLHWPWRNWPDAPGHTPIVLFPHFEARLIPGWLDKSLSWRHRPTVGLDNVVLLAPSPQWIAQLPEGKLPDRHDFLRLQGQPGARQQAWNRAVVHSEALAEDFADWLSRQCPPDAVRPLASAD